jgi:hypothetical protein
MTQALKFDPLDEETLGPSDISNPSTPVPHRLPDNIFMMKRTAQLFDPNQR